MARIFWVLGSIFAFLAVAAGAFGAHALRGSLPQSLLGIFETGARYQMYHALALLAVAWAAERRPGAAVHAAGWLFVGGILLFSGSLYILSVTGVLWLGAITPVGGVAFLSGWALLGISGRRALQPSKGEGSRERLLADSAPQR